MLSRASVALSILAIVSTGPDPLALILLLSCAIPVLVVLGSHAGLAAQNPRRSAHRARYTEVDSDADS
jgi:hypothetical protein